MKELNKQKIIMVLKTAAVVAINAAMTVVCKKMNGGDVVWSKHDPRFSKNSSKKHN